ncbi:MAG: glycosyl hydrolase 115 family protein [Bacteroidales bacterium]|nr:glycosyl hydrolase 115 family protein [Bacteroidales bacterium]
MKFSHLLILSAIIAVSCTQKGNSLTSFPEVSEKSSAGAFPLSAKGRAATLCVDSTDAPVVGIAARLLSDDIVRLTGISPTLAHSIPEKGPAVVAGTIDGSALIRSLTERGLVDAEPLLGKWESFLIQSIRIPGRKDPVLVIAGSDRRGAAFGLTTLSEEAGVSPWYWWADVTPTPKKALYIQAGRFVQKEPDVQYRGIFINDERFGGWANWVEKTFDKESGQVGPKVYEKVFELLLRLRANYLWPAMHNGSRAFNADPENARLADRYAIVMGSSHCEQMLRNNEDEWKNAGTWGDFNFLTNREGMIRYWEERVKTNGGYENIYTLGLRGIHDYPMEGAETTRDRMLLMQQAIDEQRAMLERNIDRPLEEIPQVLCTYEEVLDAYHAGLEVPDDVTLLWSDDKHGYTRNLSNPEEQKRKGGAGIYYHLSYHGDPASWIWLSPLSPAFISTELTKAYTYGARKIWIFNVGDIKPAEKEITFAMRLAWDLDRWSPEKAHGFIGEWAAETFGKDVSGEIDSIQEEYYRLQASGKDSHVYFLEYSEEEMRNRLSRWETIAKKAESLRGRIPEHLQAAYFELIEYPVRGAWMLNEYQLRSRLSLAHASVSDGDTAMDEASRTKQMFSALNAWTDKYNHELLGGKWEHFFNWRPYHWYYSDGMDAPVCTEEMLEQAARGPRPVSISVADALSEGAVIESEAEGDIPLWIHALTPIENFSKKAEDNAFCKVVLGGESFTASATPINNIWHATSVGPMWSRVGTIHLKKGRNILAIKDLKEGAKIDDIFAGIYPPLPKEPLLRLPASSGKTERDSKEGKIGTIYGLGFSDGVTVLPFSTPSYSPETAPAVSFSLDVPQGASTLQILTLPTLHVHEGRDARYAVSIDGDAPKVFSIHTEDFSAQWRWNVLRGYALSETGITSGVHTVTVSLLDPGIVLQEIRIL